MNLLDHLFIEDAIQNGKSNDGLDKSRDALNKVYNRTGTTLNELYGSSNDEAGGDERVAAPYTPRAPRPMLARTPQDESGFVGLEAPLG